MTDKCKHPIVKIVAREEDAEFVECQTCGEVFDSAEFSDIAIEEEEALAEPHGVVPPPLVGDRLPLQLVTVEVHEGVTANVKTIVTAAG